MSNDGKGITEGYNPELFDVNKIAENLSSWVRAEKSGKADAQVLPRWFVEVKSPREKALDLLEGFTKKMRADFIETIDAAGAASAIPEEWWPDLIRLPLTLTPSLRDYFKEYPQLKGKPGDTLHIPRITTPAFGSLTAGTAPADQTHTIDKIDITLSEYGGGQTINYDVLEDMVGDVVSKINDGYVEAALQSEDSYILDALDAALTAGTITNVVYGGSAASEAALVSTDTFTEDLISKAQQEVEIDKFRMNPGDWFVVMGIKQYGDLSRRDQFKQANVFGTRQLIETGKLPGWIGGELLKSSEINTGTGAGSPAATTYHAYACRKDAFGFAPKRELMVETDRAIKKRQLDLMASHRFGGELVLPDAVCAIITA